MKAFKIIKIYFYFLVLILSIAGSTYNPSIKEFYLDSADKVIVYAKEAQQISKMRVNMANVTNYDNSSKQYVSKTVDSNFSDEVFVELKKFEDRNFARIGEQEVVLMDIQLKTLSNDIELNKISLTLSGAEAEKLSELFIEYSEQKYFPTVKSGNIFVFNFDVSLSNSSNLLLKANLSDNFIVNQRFRLDIENASDFEFTMNGKKYSPKSNYPILGPYFSIVGEKIAKQEKNNLNL